MAYQLQFCWLGDRLSKVWAGTTIQEVHGM